MHKFEERDDNFGMLAIGVVILISIILMVIYDLPIGARLIG